MANSDPHRTEGTEAAAFLADPASHGGAPVEHVEHVETHAAHVFLAGARAYKLKKPVRFDFLDYSTVALREAACRAELEVNAAAKEIYLGVRPIRRDASGALYLGEDAPSEDETVDWVVAMRRFDRDAGMDRMLEAGRVDRALVHRLGDAIAAAHASAERRSDHGRAEDYATVIDDMSAALEGLAPEATRRWAAAARRSLDRQARRIEQRRRLGFVRRLHGDLHLGNVVVLDGPDGPRPTPFDAIEFSARIATIDALYDVAFAVADLIARGRTDFANALMNRYLGATRDYGGLGLWRLFLSLRLAVRAMAARLTGRNDDALRRLALAERVLAKDGAETPRLLLVGGLSGTGKTTIARGLALDVEDAAGAVHLATDEIRKRLFGAPPERRLPKPAYAPAVSGRVYRRLLRDARRALLAGVSVVLDATFTDARSRAAAAALATRLGVRFDGLWLETSDRERIGRIQDRRGDASDVSPTIALAQRAPASLEGWRRVRTDGGREAALAAAKDALGAAP